MRGQPQNQNSHSQDSRQTSLWWNSHELHAFYMDLHVESRGYKDAVY